MIASSYERLRGLLSFPPMIFTCQFLLHSMQFTTCALFKFIGTLKIQKYQFLYHLIWLGFLLLHGNLCLFFFICIYWKKVKRLCCSMQYWRVKIIFPRILKMWENYYILFLPLIELLAAFNTITLSILIMLSFRGTVEQQCEI